MANNAKLSLAALLTLFAAPALAQTMPMASHKAVYKLALGKTNGTKAPTGLSGQIAIDFSGSACEGYTTNFRQFTELQPAEGETRVSDMRTATFEDADAANFRFRIETFVDSVKSEDVDGTAQRGKDGGLAIRLTRPTPAKFDRESEISFPTEHLRRVLSAAREEKTILEVKAYDGSETGEKVFNTLSVIGKPASAPATGALEALKDMRRWPVSISYFDAAKPDARPDYVLSFDLFENGVSGSLKIDYGDFTVLGDMARLDLLPAAKCGK